MTTSLTPSTPRCDHGQIEHHGASIRCGKCGRWASLDNRDPSPFPEHPDNGHGHRYGCIRCGVDAPPPTTETPPLDPNLPAVAQRDRLRDALRGLCDGLRAAVAVDHGDDPYWNGVRDARNGVIAELNDLIREKP